MEVASPLTGTTDTTKLDTFDVSEIIRAYQDEIGVSVKKYFKELEFISLYRCNSTGYRFYFPFSIEADSSFYKELMATKESYYPGWKWENQIAFNYVRSGNYILDIGCGDGAFIGELSKKLSVKAEGLELNPAALKKAKEAGLSVLEETVQDYALIKKGQYDIVSSFQVTEHIADVKSFLSAKLELLKPGGLMIIAVPHSNPYLYKKDKYHTLNLPPHHMGLWDKETFKNLNKVLNIELIQIHIEKIDDLPYYLFTQLGMLRMYKLLIRKYKVARFIARLINKIPRPSSSILAGRNMLVVFKKL